MAAAPTEKTALVGAGEGFQARLRVYIAFLPPAFAGFLYGYSIGAASGSVSSLDAMLETPMSMLATSALTSAETSGALLASVVAFYMGDILGRRRELLVGAAFYFVGTLVTQVASGGVAYAFAFLGRLVYGMGIGFSMHAAPVYIAEISPADVRGTLIATKEAFIVLGILSGYGVVALIDSGVTESAQWRISWGVPGLISAGIFAAMLSQPYSPRWLVLQHRVDDALASLHTLRPMASDVALRGEIAEMQATLAAEKPPDGGETELQRWRQLCSARRALVACLGLIVFQQITGQPTVLYYAQTIFEDCGFAVDAAKSADVIIGVAKLIATCVSVPLVDRAGRRPLLLGGISLMLAALVLLAAGFGTVDPSGAISGTWSGVVVVALVLYVSGYQMGYGPIAWVLIGECFPLHSRGRALGVAAVLNFGLNAVVTLTSGALTEAVSQSAIFAFYAVMCVCSLAHVYTLVPETRGKTLEQIEELMRTEPSPA